MDKYIARDSVRNSVVFDIEKSEYEEMKKFYEKYKWFENLMVSYQNYLISYNGYANYYKNITDNEAHDDLQDIQDDVTFMLTSSITFSRMFIDNTKNFIKMAELRNVGTFNRIINEPDMKLIKALRDYATHFSIPIRSTEKTIDIVKEVTSFKFYIAKDDLLENDGNKQNTKVIQFFDGDDVNVHKLITENNKNIHEIAELIVKKYIDAIDNNVKEFLLEHKKNKRFANSYMKVDVVSGRIFPQEVVHMNPNVFAILMFNL